MAKKTPSDVLSTWAVDAGTGDVTFNISDFTSVGVTAAELHPETGDFGTFLRALMETLSSFYADEVEANTAPSRWSVAKGTPFAITIAGAVNPQRVPFAINVDIAAPATAYEVVPE